MDHNQQNPDIAHEATQGSQRGERFNPHLNWKSGLAIVTGVILLGILVANLGTGEDATQTTPQVVSEEQVDLSIQTISGYPEVIEAAVTQVRDRLSLVLVVLPDTSVERAQELGDNFVRQVKLHGPDSNPSKEVGAGKYDYLVDVYSSDETLITRGTKNATSESVSWQ